MVNLPTMDITPKTVIDFWFTELSPKDWYRKSDELDDLIHSQFGLCHQTIVNGETDHWRETAEGRLSEIIVLDQFSRNMFRGSAKSFEFDPLALALAQEMVGLALDKQLNEQQRPFAYMPYMHSESLVVHDAAMLLFADTDNLDYEIKHRNVIQQFGRYPHRNELLGRQSTPDEIEWMKTNPGF